MYIYNNPSVTSLNKRCTEDLHIIALIYFETIYLIDYMASTNNKGSTYKLYSYNEN